MVVLTIIALFAALVGPALFKNVGKAKITKAKSPNESFGTALGTYKLDVGTFPTTEQGLQALRVKPGDVANWKRSLPAQGRAAGSLAAPVCLQVPGRTWG